MSIFDKINVLEEFELLEFVFRKNYPREPEEGTVEYKGNQYYFKFHHEFDCGNTYIVYASEKPVYYFMLYHDLDVDAGCPMIKSER